jgi:hypothetical protein
VAQLDHLAFQAVDHLPDLELAQSPAAAVHESDRRPDRGAACLVGPERVEMADHATGLASVALGHSDLGPRKRSCRLLTMLQAMVRVPVRSNDEQWKAYFIRRPRK